MTEYILLACLLLSLSILYRKYVEKQYRTSYPLADEYDQLRKYLLNEQDRPLLHRSTHKPILWIYLPHEYNARHWLSFGSRSSFELNQPYLFFTLKSIIQQCDSSFKILLIDDATFPKLLPDFTVALDTLSNPIQRNVRQLLFAKLIHRYGGVHVPISFLCFRDLISMYHRGTREDSMFVCENINSHLSAVEHPFYPDAEFMGAGKNNRTLQKLIRFMETLFSSDFTAESQLEGKIDAWCFHQPSSKVRVIPAMEVGVKTMDDEKVTVERLFGDEYLSLYDKMYGLWIPSKMILNRPKYEWFARMSPDQIASSSFLLAKYMVLAVAPPVSLSEGLEEAKAEKDREDREDREERKNSRKENQWIGFWQVPMNENSHLLNIFGMKPLGLGNDVPRATNAGNLP